VLEEFELIAEATPVIEIWGVDMGSEKVAANVIGLELLTI
jgi:hypothetical protein